MGGGVGLIELVKGVGIEMFVFGVFWPVGFLDGDVPEEGRIVGCLQRRHVVGSRGCLGDGDESMEMAEQMGCLLIG